MEDELLVPNGKIDLELRQLTLCRWGLMLLAAGWLVQIGCSLVAPTGDAAEQVNVVLGRRAVALGSLALALIPGGWLLYANARSARWRRWGMVLLAACGVDLALVVIVCVFQPIKPDSPVHLSLGWRVADRLGSLATWLELWCQAVVIGEFAIASRSGRLLTQTESIGNFIIAGTAVAFMLTGWVVPVAIDPRNADAITQILAFIEFGVGITVHIWSLVLLTSAARHAGALLDRGVKPPPT